MGVEVGLMAILAQTALESLSAMGSLTCAHLQIKDLISNMCTLVSPKILIFTCTHLYHTRS